MLEQFWDFLLDVCEVAAVKVKACFNYFYDLNTTVKLSSVQVLI